MSTDDNTAIDAVDTSQTPPLVGDRKTRKAKRSIVNEVFAGATLEEACNQLGHKMEVVTWWMDGDPRFKAWVDHWESHNQDVLLRKIENSVMTAGLEDPKIGLQVLKHRKEEWQPTKKVQHSRDDDTRREYIPGRQVIDIDGPDE